MTETKQTTGEAAREMMTEGVRLGAAMMTAGAAMTAMMATGAAQAAMKASAASAALAARKEDKTPELVEGENVETTGIKGLIAEIGHRSVIPAEETWARAAVRRSAAEAGMMMPVTTEAERKAQAGIAAAEMAQAERKALKEAETEIATGRQEGVLSWMTNGIRRIFRG